MDFGAYAERAVALVNTDAVTPGEPYHDGLAVVADLPRLLPNWPTLAERAGRRDLEHLRELRDELREVFQAGAAGDDAAVVRRLNALLATHPIRPEISGHDQSSLHLHVHVGGPGSSMSAVCAAEALMGLTMTVIDLGADRLGVCAAPGCGRVYLDTSRNRSRRYCSDRCSTRVAVAAHRARQRAGQ